MRLCPALGTAIIAFGLISSAVVAAENHPGELRPTLHTFNLKAIFERVRLIPNTRQALLFSGEGKQVARFDLDKGELLGEPCVLPQFGDLVIDQDGSFAYLVTTDLEVLSSILRLALSKWDPLTSSGQEGSCVSSILPLDEADKPKKVSKPLLALVGDDRLIVADRESEVVFVQPVETFNENPPKPSWVRVEPVAVERVYNKILITAVTGLPKENKIFFSAPHAPEIHELDMEPPYKRRLLTALRQPGDQDRPLAMAVVAGKEDKGQASLSAAVADQVGSRLLLFDYNPTFRAFDFVTEGAITVTDPERKAQGNPGITPLIVAASNGLSAIVVGSRQARRLYFFSRLEDGKVLQQLNSTDLGPVMDLDVAKDGSIAVILADNGRSLIRVDRPDAPAPPPSDSSQPGTAGNKEILDAQKMLVALGYSIGAADGVLGPSTVNAISLFQRAQGLSLTGTLDSETKSRLRDVRQRRWYRDRAEFEKRFKEQGVRQFKVDEFLPGKADTCTRSKSFPPTRTWCNAFLLAKTMDTFRDRWKYPVIIESAFQSQECGENRENIAYSEFRALDFRSARGNPDQWVKLLEIMRAERLFEGRVEARGDRVHLDLEPEPNLWVFVGSRSKDGKFASGYFDIADPPEEGKGQVLKPKQTMFLRTTASRMEGKEEILGEPISYLEQNLSLAVERVVDVQKDGAQRYWAGGQVVGSDTTDALKGHWFVVIETHATEATAHPAAEKLRKRYPDFSLNVYRAHNGKFAVVAGAGLDQSAAKKLVLEARCAGLSDDAFIRLSKTWKKSEPPRPEADL